MLMVLRVIIILIKMCDTTSGPVRCVSATIATDRTQNPADILVWDSRPKSNRCASQQSAGTGCEDTGWEREYRILSEFWWRCAVCSGGARPADRFWLF